MNLSIILEELSFKPRTFIIRVVRSKMKTYFGGRVDGASRVGSFSNRQLKYIFTEVTILFRDWERKLLKVWEFYSSFNVLKSIISSLTTSLGFKKANPRLGVVDELIVPAFDSVYLLSLLPKLIFSDPGSDGRVVPIVWFLSDVYCVFLLL